MPGSPPPLFKSLDTPESLSNKNPTTSAHTQPMMTASTRSIELCHLLLSPMSVTMMTATNAGPQRVVLFQKITHQSGHQNANGHGGDGLTGGGQQCRPAKGTHKIGDDPHERRLERGMKIRLRHQHGGNRRDPCCSGQLKKFVAQRRHHRCNGGLGGKNDGFKMARLHQKPAFIFQTKICGQSWLHLHHCASRTQARRLVLHRNNQIDCLRPDDLACH